MKIAITGRRDLKPDKTLVICDYMAKVCIDPEVEEIFFGGAVGADTYALRFALTARPRGSPLRLTVIVPDILKAQPWEAQYYANYADRVVELQRPITKDDGWESFKARDHCLVDEVGQEGQLTAFWDGVESGGTHYTIQYALRKGVPWEWVQI